MLNGLSTSTSSKNPSCFIDPGSYGDMLGKVTGSGGRYNGWLGTSGKGAGKPWNGECWGYGAWIFDSERGYEYPHEGGGDADISLGYLWDKFLELSSFANECDVCWKSGEVCRFCPLFSVRDFCLLIPSSVFRRGCDCVASSTWDCSGDADEEPALRSRSSSLLLIFFPIGISTDGTWKTLCHCGGGVLLTVITLGNPVLDPPPFSKIWYLGPVFVGVCTGAKSTAATMGWRILRRGRASKGVWIAIAMLHGLFWDTRQSRWDEIPLDNVR